MTAVAWTAIGVLAVAEVFMVVYLGRKLDAFEAHMNACFDRVERRIDATISRMDSRLPT